MKNFKLIFFFTLKEAIKRRAFIVTTAIICVIIVAISVIPRLIDESKKRETPEEPTTVTEVKEEDKTSTYYIVDGDNLFPNATSLLSTVEPYSRFVTIKKSEVDEYTKKITSADKVYMMEIIKADPLPRIKFYFDSFVTTPRTTLITEALRRQYLIDRFGENSVDENLVTLALTPMVVDVENVGGSTGVSGYLLGTVLLMVMFIAIYYCGYSVASSVASEKSSRIMETLVVSASPTHILLGKVAAMGFIGLLQVVTVLFVALISANLILPGGFEIGGVPLDFSTLNIQTALLLVFYFIFGYALYAMLNAVCGATVSRIEDLQTAMMPVALLAMLSYYLSLGNMMTANGVLSAATSYIPFVTPFRMAFRLMNESVPTIDIVITMLILAVSVVIVAFIAIRLYTASVLHYGDRLKLKNLVRMSKKA